MELLIGQYNHTVDTKGRVSLPSRLREDLGDTFYVTRGLEHCLFLYNVQGWTRMDEKLRELKLTSREARAFSRLFFAGASELNPDRQGRILLPPQLRAYANIEKDVVIIGVSNRVEIWAKDAWDAYVANENMDYDALSESLHDFDL